MLFLSNFLCSYFDISNYTKTQVDLGFVEEGKGGKAKVLISWVEVGFSWLGLHAGTTVSGGMRFPSLENKQFRVCRHFIYCFVV